MASGKTKKTNTHRTPAPPELVILLGGHGAGKSTYYDLHLRDKGLPFINADLIARELFGDDAEANSWEAARIAEDARYRLIDARHSFCFETVFSHPSKVDFLAHAKANGYQVKMIAVYTEYADLNVARVSQQVAAGGHSVPEQKILDRIPRTHEHIGAAIPLCDQFILLDNSSATQPFLLRIALVNGLCQFRHHKLPEFASNWLPQADPCE